MSLEHQIYGSTDWHLPSPSSTPKSVTFPDASFQTPKTEAAHHSHFTDAWSTPRVNGHQTPAQTPSFAVSTPIDRPLTSYSHKVRTPEDPEFHVNHLARGTLPLPPVEPSQRLSSSPGPLSARRTADVRLRESPSVRSRPVSMDTSQMQTPPPTRDANSRRSIQHQAANGVATPATVIARTPLQAQQQETFNQTPFDFPNLQFSPDGVQFPSNGPLSAPALPQSRLFWDQSSDSNNMDVDFPIASDPFGPTPHKIGTNINWQAFDTPTNQMNPQAFQALHGMSSPGVSTTFVANDGAPSDGVHSRPASFVSTSASVDPSMLFSFSSPGPSTSFAKHMQHFPEQGTRQPYETQFMDSVREREMVNSSKAQHSRTNTSSSTASLENSRPVLQRSVTDSGFRKSRPSSMESRVSNSTAGFNIPRRSSPLKRQSGGSLTSIPEVRRPKTRLVIDESGRARTETVHVDDDPPVRGDTGRDSQKDLRRQYPGLWTEDDTESDSDDGQVTLSRNSSFSIPQRRPSKVARTNNSGVERTNSLKMTRPSSGVFDKSAFETIRPVKKAGDNPFRRFSMMDFPTSFNDILENEDDKMPDSPGDALGALKKVVEGRQKRIERSTQNTLRAHNQRWAQATAERHSGNSPHGHFDPFSNFSNSINASPAANTDASFTTPSTDRSSLSSECTRCICHSTDDGRPMVQCESCNKWLHMACVGLSPQNLPPVFVCVFCTGQTPVARGGRVRGPLPSFESPLTHKSVLRR